jgi:hypothetical protein
VNSYLQRFRFAATGRWAVSIRTYLLIFPFGYLVSVERELVLNQVSLSRAAGIALAGELASFLYLFLAQDLLLGQRNEQLQPAWRCFFVWITTGLVRGLGVSAYARWAYGYDLDALRRIPAATSYTTVVMALAAVYFGSIERKRTELQAMNSLNELLSRDQGELAYVESQRSADANKVLEGILLPQVKSLQLGIKSALEKEEGGQSAVDLSKLLAQSIEISRALETERESLLGHGQTNSKGVDSSKKVSYWTSVVPKIISIRLTSVFYILGVFSGQFPRNGIEGVLAGLLGLIPLMFFLLPMSQIIKRVKRGRFALFLIAFLSAFLVSYFYNVAQPKIGFSLDNPYKPWYSALKTTYGIYFASVIASLIVEVSDKHESASKRSLATREKVNQLFRRSSELEKAIYEGQYGALQGKISGVTMALHLIGSETMGRIAPERKLELLSNANELLGQSLEEIHSLKMGAL